jgi:hypothetical protein
VGATVSVAFPGLFQSVTPFEWGGEVTFSGWKPPILGLRSRANKDGRLSNALGWQRLETADPWALLSPPQGWVPFKRTGVAAVGNRRSLGFALAPPQRWALFKRTRVAAVGNRRSLGFALAPPQRWALFKRTRVAAVGNRRSLDFALAPTRMGAFQAHSGGSGWKLPVLGVRSRANKDGRFSSALGWQRLETAHPWGSLSRQQGWALFKRTRVAAVGNRRSLGLNGHVSSLGKWSAIGLSRRGEESSN